MKKICLLLLSIHILCTVSGQQKEIRTVPDFTGIEASGVFDISVEKGDQTSLLIEADEEIMPYIVSEVKGNVLHLYITKHKVKNIKTLKAFVVMKNLDVVALSGACRITSGDLFASDRFEADLSGASGLNLQMNARQMEINASGASSIELTTKTNKQTSIDISGSSNLKIQLNTSEVTLNVSGASNVELTGRADKMDIDASGTSDINALDFVVKSVVIGVSGVSKVTTHATNSLKANSSGFSKVSYKGSPSNTESNISNFSSIKKIE